MNDKAEMILSLEPPFNRFVTGDYGRVLLVANNPHVDTACPEALQIGEKDILVQFNSSPHFALFADQRCHKVHVLNANGNGTYWGMGSNDRPEPDVHAQAQTDLTVFFTNWLSKVAQAYLGTLTDDAMGGLMLSEWAPPFLPYPEGRVPSVGFMTVSYFRAVNLIRQFARRRPLPLIMVGFSGVYPPGKAWVKHDFEFEQKVYKVLVDMLKLDPNGAPQLDRPAIG